MGTLKCILKIYEWPTSVVVNCKGESHFFTPPFHCDSYDGPDVTSLIHTYIHVFIAKITCVKVVLYKFFLFYIHECVYEVLHTWMCVWRASCPVNRRFWYGQSHYTCQHTWYKPILQLLHSAEICIEYSPWLPPCYTIGSATAQATRIACDKQSGTSNPDCYHIQILEVIRSLLMKEYKTSYRRMSWNNL